jgi:deoxyribonuclease-4
LPARAFQVFTKNQNQWAGRPLSDEAVGLWEAALAEHGLRAAHVCSHDSYLINLASGDPVVRARSVAAFVDEIERAGRLGIPLLVFHPGSHLGAGEEAGVAAVSRALDECLDRAGAGKWPEAAGQVTLCIETTAGQGTNLGWRFEHLRDLIAASRHPDRLAVCLDTCHVFAAGYPLQTPAEWRATAAAFDAAVGLDRLRVLHLNDSRKGLGSRVDRHERVGEGQIGAAPFRHILRDRRLRGTLGILEVPGGNAVYAEDLAKLRRLRAR